MGVDDNPIKESKHRLRQRFEVLRKLGHGTYGKVQLAVNKDTGQEVAIKTIKKAKIENEQDLIRIRREIQIMSYVQHPHIIHIHEVFENKEKIVLVMQYASGGEMYDYLNTRKSLAETEARRIFRQIVSAVYYCHKNFPDIHFHNWRALFENVFQYFPFLESITELYIRQEHLPLTMEKEIMFQFIMNRICHRDLKLENILLDEKGNAKIADFGLSNIFSENNFLHTFCGSPLYASPEIVRGKPYYGPEVDCWSLGVLLYTFIYGAMPFDGSNFRALVKQISKGDYYEPKKKSDASGLIRHLLTVEPTKRATIFDICNHWWVNLGYEHSLIQVAEDMANFSPVNMDALLNIPYLKACEESKSSSMKCSNNIKLSSDNQSKVVVEKKDEKNETVSNYILNTVERNNNLANSNSISCSDDSLMLNDLESPGNGITTPNECSHSSTDKAFTFPESNIKKTVRKITENSHDINKRSKETSTISEQDNVIQNKLNMADNILIRKRSNVESVFNKNLCSKNETTELCLTSKSKEETCIKNKQIKQNLDKKGSISQSISNQTNKNDVSEEFSVIIYKKNFGTKNKESEESLSVKNNENEKCKKLKENECILIDKKSNNARISTNKINAEMKEYVDSNVSELKSPNNKTEVTNTDDKEKINISEEGKSSNVKIEKNIENTDVSSKKDFIQNSFEKIEAEKCQDSKTKESEENKKISVKKGPGKLIIPKFFESSQLVKGADTKKVNIPSWAVSDAKKAFESKTQEKKPLIIPTRRVSDARNKFEQKIESNAYITLPRRASKQSTILKEEINEQRRKSDTNNFPIKELPSLNNSNENADQNGEIKSNDQKNLEIGIKKTSKSENENDIKSENNNTCIENQKENSIFISENNLSLTSESLKKENCLQETIHKSVDSENCSDTQDHKLDLSSNECNINDDQIESSDTKRISNNSIIPISSPIHKVLPEITNIVTEKTNEFILPTANSEIDNTIEEISKLNSKAYQTEETQNNILCKEQDDYINKVDKNNSKIEAHLKNDVDAKEHDEYKNKDDQNNNKISETLLKNNILTKESDNFKSKDDKNNNKIEENHLSNNVHTKEPGECKNKDDKNNNNIEENHKIILNKTENIEKQNNNNNNQNKLINKENMESDKFTEVNTQITIHDSIPENKFEKLELAFNLQNQNQSQFSNKEFSYIETEMEYKSKENKCVSPSKRRNSDISLFSRSSEKYNALGLRDIHDLPESCYNDMLQFLHSKETSRSRYSSHLSKQKQIKHTINKDHQNRIHNWLRSEQINGHSTDRDSSDNDEDFDIHFDYSYPTPVNSSMLSSLNKPENNSKSINPTSKYPRTMRSISQIDYNSMDEISKDHKHNSLSNEEIDNPIEIPNKELKFTRRNSHSTIYKDSINLNSSLLYLQNPIFKPLSSYEIQNNPQIKRISNAAEIYGTWHRKPSCHSNHKTFQQQRDRFYTSSPINETHNRSNLVSSGMIRDIYGTIRRPKHNYTRSISVDIPQNPTIYKLQNYPSQEYSSINTHHENDVFNIKDCRNSYLQNKYSSNISNYNNNNNPSKSDSLKLSSEDDVKNNEGTENHNIKLQNSIELSYNQNNNDKNIKCTEEKLISKQDSDKNLNDEHIEEIYDQEIQKFPLQMSNSSNQSHINTDKLSSLSLLEALKLKGYRNVISQQNPLFISKSKVSEENSFIENFDNKQLKMNNSLELTENKINLEIPQMNHSNLHPLIETDSDVREKLAPVCEMNELSSCRVDSDQEETVSERIWRKSFYSRFNDNRMKKRKTYREGDLKAQSLSGSNWNVLIEENLRDDFLYPRRSSLTIGNNNWSSLPRSSAKPLVKHHSYPDPVLQFNDSVGNTSKQRCSKMSRRSSSLGIVEDGLDVHKNTAYLNMLQQSHNAVSSDYNIPYSTSVGSNYNKLHGTLRPFSIYNSGNSSKEEYLSEENFKSRINPSNALSRRRFSALDNYLFTSKSPSLSDSVTSLIDYDKPENEEVS